jgi:hypothetical protein
MVCVRERRQWERISSHMSAEIENYRIIQELNLEYSEIPFNLNILIKKKLMLQDVTEGDF